MRIDGNETPWGRLSGKLKLSREDVYKLFGYKMSDRGVGVYFRRRGGIDEIVEIVPHNIVKTKSILMSWDRMSILGKLSSELRLEINRIWTHYARGLQNGQNVWVGENLRRLGLPPVWSNLLISKGELPVPCVREVIVTRLTASIKLCVAVDYELGVCVFEPLSCRFQFLGYFSCSSKYLTIGFKEAVLTSRVIFYFWHRWGDKYSNSISIERRG